MDIKPRPKDPVFERFKFRRALGRKLRELRERHHLSQIDCAMFMGVDPSKLCRWESGTANVTVLQLLQFCEIVGCWPIEVLEGLRTSGEDV